VVVAVACLDGRVHLYSGDVGDGANRLVLYSTIAEALAALLALLVTATLVATQLATQTFTPRVVRYRIRDPWLWGAIVVFSLGILSSLVGIARSGSLHFHTAWQQRQPDLVLMLALASLAYTGPFTLAMLRSMESQSFIAWLLKIREYQGVEDFMRNAINQGLSGELGIAILLLRLHAHAAIATAQGNPGSATTFAKFGVRLGRYAATKKDPESFGLALSYLTFMTTDCTHMMFRAAADVFNEAVVNLHTIAEETFGR